MTQKCLRLICEDSVRLVLQYRHEVHIIAANSYSYHDMKPAYRAKLQAAWLPHLKTSTCWPLSPAFNTFALQWASDQVMRIQADGVESWLQSREATKLQGLFASWQQRQIDIENAMEDGPLGFGGNDILRRSLPVTHTCAHCPGSSKDSKENKSSKQDPPAPLVELK